MKFSNCLSHWKGCSGTLGQFERSSVIALAVVPAAAHILFGTTFSSRTVKRILLGALVAAGVVVGFLLGWWLL